MKNIKRIIPQKKLAVFDIDGTIFRRNLHFELLEELVYEGIFKKEIRSELTRVYGDWLNNEGTYENYRKKLAKLYEENIKNCSVFAVQKAAKKVALFNHKRIYIYTRDLIKKLKKTHLLMIISGSPIEIVSEYARLLDFDVYFGSIYQTNEKNLYTGKTFFEPTVDKGEIVKEFIQEKGLSLEGSLGIGDTESDASFLELTEISIAFNPNSNLRAIALEKGWQVVVEKKDVIYTF